ncbi:APX1 [Symbiodinium sp. CCMP2592]|nr:APX1 [Symbiodinium sp. CCMP2592]
MTMTHAVLAFSMLCAPLVTPATACSMGDGSACNLGVTDGTTLIQTREAGKAMDFHQDSQASETERAREVASLPGSAWTAQEIATVKRKLRRMMKNPSKAISEANIQVEKANRYEPNPAKVVRLVFHDCMKYTDGTGGCDGCLDWQGVGRRSELADDGHNNGLYVVAEALEHIYTRTDYPSGAPVLDHSLKSTNKSRADLWALAGTVAVQVAMELNNKVCDAPSRGAEGQYHPRWGQSDCKVAAPRKIIFKTGRRDCSGHPFEEAFEPALQGIERRSYMTNKREAHPDPHADGWKTLAYFKNNFGFNRREVVAIMGAHTIGTFHVEVSGFKYNWKFSHKIFNNGYYRLLTLKRDWSQTGIVVNGQRLNYKDINGEHPPGVWAAEEWRELPNGGPFQVVKKKVACTPCDAPPGHAWWDKWSVPRFGRPVMNHTFCCTNLKEGHFCNPQCVHEFDDEGIHETMLPSDLSMHRKLFQNDDGVPQGCGRWNGKWKGSVDCGDAYFVLADVVEEFANNQTSWLAEFFDVYEKMLSNGYAADELTGVRAAAL